MSAPSPEPTRSGGLAAATAPDIGRSTRLEVAGGSSVEIPAVGQPEARELDGLRRSRLDARGWIVRRYVAAADFVGVLTVLGLALLARSAVGRPELETPALLVFLAAIPLWGAISMVAGLYHRSQRHIDFSLADEMWPLFQAVTIWAWLLLVAQAIVGESGPETVTIVAAWLIAAPVLLMGRSLARDLARRTDSYRQRAVVVGSSADAIHVERRLGRHPEYGIEIVDRVDVDDPDLIDRVARAGADRVIVAGSPATLEARSRILRELGARQLDVDVIPGDAELFRPDVTVHHIEGLPLMTLAAVSKPRVMALVKRSFDLAIAVPALALLAPYLLYCAIRIRHETPGPALYRQQRVGKDGRRFSMVKFRTMAVDADEQLAQVRDEHQGQYGIMFKLRDDPRVTPCGARLRRRSIDELPQLLNVLRGEMSLVGPRPLPISEASEVRQHWQRRFDVKPGMTGPWQVMGRSDIPFEDMVKLDCSYVASWSMAEDMRLLARTIAAVTRGRGAY